MGNETEKGREERGYDSFTVAQDGTLSGCMDDSGMTRFVGQVSSDGSYSAKLIRLEGTLQGTISPEGVVAGAVSTHGMNVPCHGRRILNEAKPGASPFAGEYRVTQPTFRPPFRQEKEPPPPFPKRGAAPIQYRGIKFNLPLDMRTPSYSDGGDCAQWNIPTVWDMDFWHGHLDHMRDMGYNALSLWNLNPFPSLVKVPEFPDVALEDVWRTTLPFDDSYSGRGVDLVRPEHYQNYEVVKRLTIEEKIAFWRWVMAYAHDCGIQVFLFTWNIYVFGEQGKYGITPDMENQTTKDYFRASVRELIRTYPDLDGIGIAGGEQMSRDGAQNEQWLWETYGLGICDGLRDTPERPFRVIHRLHQTKFDVAEEIWRDLPCPLEYSDKYSGAHMYSSVEPPFVRKTIRDLPPGRKLWLEVRSDDLYMHRWGAPEYARKYLRNMPEDQYLAGFLLGADGYVPAREYAETDPSLSGQLHLEKHWYSYLIWGKLAKAPDTPDGFFREAFRARFSALPVEATDALMGAMAAAGEIVPQVSRLYFKDIDSPWYPEACLSHPQMFGFLDIRRWVKSKNNMPGGGCLSIVDYVDAIWEERPLPDAQTPVQAAQRLRSLADGAMEQAARAEKAAQGCPDAGQEHSFLSAVRDQKALAWLGRYYADKITAAVCLRLALLSGNEAYREEAVGALQRALKHWKSYAAAAMAQYRPQRLCRHGMLDLLALTEQVAKDIEIAKWLTKDLL